MMDNKWLTVKIPAESSLIYWENLGIGKVSRFFRQVLIYLISFSLMLITFAITLASKGLQRQINNDYKNLDCPDEAINQ